MSNNISAYSVNLSTGALTPVNGSPFPGGTAPQSLAITPRGQYLYTANQGSNDVSGYLIDSSSGALTSIGTFTAGSGGAFGAAVDPTGKYAYIAAYGGIFGYSINNVNTCFPCVPAGALFPLAGSPFGTGSNVAYGAWTPNSIVFDYTASFAYATGGPYGPGTVTAFTFDSATGNLTQFPGPPFSTGDGSVSLALVRPRPHPEYTASAIPDQAYAPLLNIDAAAINNEGAVAGTATTKSGAETLELAFLYANGVTGHGGGLASNVSIAHALNDKGDVAGESQTSVPLGGFIPSQAYLYNGTTTINLDGRSGGESAALGINNNGQVTGSRSTGTCTTVPPFNQCTSPPNFGDTHAFLYSGSGLVDLGTLGGDFSIGAGINNSGEIAGSSNLTKGGSDHFFLYTGGMMHDLGPGSAVAINNKGEIVGVSSSGAPVLYDRTFHTLPNPPGGSFSPAALNNRPAVVGFGSFGPLGPNHAVIYRDGHSYDLNSLVLSSLPLFTTAAGINDKGQIVVKAVDDSSSC